MDEIEYDDDLFETWKKSAVTQRLLKAYASKQKSCQLELESHASHSTDPDVRGAWAKLIACRVLVAELQGHDQVGGQQ